MKCSYSIKNFLIPHFSKLTTLLVLGNILSHAVFAESENTSQELEQVNIFATTPGAAGGMHENKIPTRVQVLDADDINNSYSLSITDVLSDKFSGVTTNAAQNNPLQPDVQFRGFTASPLLGLPIGISVYQNGVRLNEPLGDTVNWDTISTDAIAEVQYISGANPLYGLNSLGGALAIKMKNGFTHAGHSANASYGSFDRKIVSVQSGANNGNYSYYFNFKRFDEDGWRDISPSDANNYYGNVSYRNDYSELNLNLQHANTDLTGNGASPIELLKQSYDDIFTAPDVTENKMTSLSLDGSHWLNDSTLLSGRMYTRSTETDAFNGDLAEDDDDDNGGQNDFNAINNISTNDQDSKGFDSQVTFNNLLANKENTLTAGLAFNEGKAAFDSRVQEATLDPDTRSTQTSGAVTGGFIGDLTKVKSRTRSYSTYVTDTISVTEKVSLTGSARYDITKIRLRDKTGEQPELDGDHTFKRINPALGMTYQYTPDVNFYAGYSESSRVPTPIELSCNEEVLSMSDDPDHTECRLPNAFLADPPLDDVIAKNFEVGLRGVFEDDWNWHMGLFHTNNKDDIIFQSTGRATGLFKNVDKTQRKGAELGLAYDGQNYKFGISYSYLKATFRDSFIALSPNHNNASDLNGNGEDDDIRVKSGDSIPGLPEHTLKLSGGYETDKLLLGVDWHIRGRQYMRGDESNEMDQVPGYSIVNLQAHYEIYPSWQLTLRVNNVFDKEYYTFGIIGEEPDEAPGLDDFEDPRFYGAGPERGGWLGLQARF